MILVTKTSDQTRQRGHSLYLYKSYLSPEHLVLPPLLPCCSPGYPSWQLLNQPFLFYIFFVCVCVFDPIYSGAILRLSVYV